MASLWHDMRYGVRMLRKSPQFTAIALITLGIGIGANTIMFSVADMLLFRPLGITEPDELVCCGIRDFPMSYSTYLALRNNNHAFRDLMVQDEGCPVTVVHQDTAKQMTAMFVSGNYFSFLGVAPMLGRGFLADEDRQDASPVAVLSHRTWQHLGMDPAVVGRFLRVNGTPCQIVGVAPAGFSGMSLAGPDFWLPMGSYLTTMRLSRGMSKPPAHASDLGYPGWLTVTGRLRPDIDVLAARASLQAVIPILRAEHPERWSPRCMPYIYPVPRVSTIFQDKERPIMTGLSLFMMGVSVAILIIACLNLASMLIIRGAGRCREIAVRLALGGGRSQIIRQLLTESLLLTLLGGGLGLVLAFGGITVVNAWFASSQRPEWRCLQAGLSTRALGITLCTSCAASLLFGLRPALGLSRRDIVGELKESSSLMERPLKRRESGLSVLCQIAMAVVIVMIAVMFAHHALQVARSAHGADMENTLVVHVDPFSGGYDRTRGVEVCEALADRLESLPGVESLGASPSFSFGRSGNESIYEHIPGGEREESERLVAKAAAVSVVGRDYFSSTGIPLLQGRSFNPLDRVPQAEKVVIIDQTLAGRLRPNGQALGCLIKYSIFSDRSEPYRVVGIARSIPGGQNEQAAAQAYIPAGLDQMCTCLYLRMTDGRSTEATQRQLGEIIREVDPHLPVLSIATLAYRCRDHETLWFARISARLTSIAGGTALFLAALGISAVKGYMVASRTREIGIRKALGATRLDIMSMVFREGLVLTVIGLILGLLLGWGVTRFLASMLYGYRAVDAGGIAVTIGVLGVVSLAAGHFPARKAAKVDPMTALRSE